MTHPTGPASSREQGSGGQAQRPGAVGHQGGEPLGYEFPGGQGPKWSLGSPEHRGPAELQKRVGRSLRASAPPSAP